MVARIKLLLKSLAALVVFGVYVWYRAVLEAPAVKRRKAVRRSRA